jgi:putative ABC transport system permease protein
MQTLLQDLRFSLRLFTRRPSLTFAAIIALALGIGAATAVFSVVNAVLLRGLSFPDPDHLAMVWIQNTEDGRDEIAFATAEYVDYRDQNEVFEQLGGVNPDSFNLTADGEPLQVDGARVTANLFSLLGVRPALGRIFAPDEDQPGHDQVVMITHRLWESRYGSAKSIIGRTLNIQLSPVFAPAGNTQVIGGLFTVIGVLPADFRLPSIEGDVWIPLTLDYNNLIRIQQRMRVIGRLKPGVSLQKAQSDLDRIAKRLEEMYPEASTGDTAFLRTLRDEDVGQIRPSLLMLLAGVSLVLLIACANVANLLLARAAERDKEVALRTALGASRGRIIRQMLTESIVLGIMGGGVGLVLAYWGTRVLAVNSPANIPRISEVSIDGFVLAVTLAISILTGVIFGLAPALQLSKSDLSQVLKQGARVSPGGFRHKLRSFLVISEVALALMLLVGAGLIAKSFMRLQGTEKGFDPKGVLTAQTSLPFSRYTEPTKRSAFYRQVLDRVRALPGVEFAGAVNIPPAMDDDQVVRITIEGRPEPAPGQAQLVSYRTVTPNYFQSLGIRLLRGRDFREEDLQTFSFIINESMARRYWPNEDPIGKRIRLGTNPQNPYLFIVGIVEDYKQFLDAPPDPTLYVSNIGQLSMTFTVRTASNPTSLASALRGEVLAVDPNQPIYNVMTMEQRLVNASPIRKSRFQTTLLLTFSLSALLLAAVGIYGVISYSVTQRTREIGIRIAFGAQPGDVVKLIVGQAMILTSIGVIAGLAVAFALTRLLSSLLFGVSATDPIIYAGTAAILAVVALLASYVPARRASRVEPMEALRYD